MAGLTHLPCIMDIGSIVTEYETDNSFTVIELISETEVRAIKGEHRYLDLENPPEAEVLICLRWTPKLEREPDTIYGWISEMPIFCPRCEDIIGYTLI